jgi:hypothetical protein
MNIKQNNVIKSSLKNEDGEDEQYTSMASSSRGYKATDEGKTSNEGYNSDCIFC